jgi:hypothetical protein
MGRTLTNNFSLQYAIEDSIGVLPGSPEWKLLEPNEISTYGASITTVPRSPISKNRQRRKGAVTDLDSAVEFGADLTMDSFIDFIEGFCFANFTGAPVAEPTAATSTAFTVPTMSAAVLESSIVVSRGFADSNNNGSFIVDSGATTTSIPVVGGLTAETPAATRNCTVEVAGFRFPTADLEVNSDGNLVTTATDLTTLDIEVGQVIHVGGALAANRFTESANYGYARVVSIAANLMVLDKKSSTFVTDDGTGQEVDLLFGRFIKNVAVDDSNFLERSFHFEGAYQDLANPTGNEYEYAIGNFCNQIGFELPLTDKATTTFGFVGTDTEDPVEVGSRKTNADSPKNPVQTTAFNTSADIARLRITQVDETGLTTDFKSVTLNINNNVTPEKVLGTLGAKYMNSGNFEVDLESQLLFTDSAVVAAIRGNTTLTLDFAISNSDGAIFVDIPALTLDGGDKEYPVNESILINTTAMAFGDTTYNASIMVSLFPQAPAAA